MKSAVIVFPGLNRDRDMIAALEKVTGEKPHLAWHGDSDLPDVDLVVVPGGFSYGDYLRAGAIAARSPMLQRVKEHADRGGLTLGVCNGFQILTETGLLPGALMRNRDLKFLCKVIHLKAENTTSPFTTAYKGHEAFPCPIAHHDGNYFIDQDGLKALEDNGQIAFRYCDENGNVTLEANPNGSIENIAGITNKQGNVLGMMPHPENLIEAAHGGIEGRYIFDSLVAAVA
ncbi:phosphoribosylformylglycinamidine synthase [Maritalea mobilis]|uniref:Phosphoribosylformylglycinamidine synthase subunit PurQ n=1 Tax=Maritalea mobilis TaxID=483324 RepID=A0A4R6VRI0_9HYPH|nr:phosphoribosylformylglycinamidine synthase subunit PurQ [Maritalea mobilis]TDQ66619.1 phosphoribosylformylglycinamidine synthase [Maritalea mobilis]